jgi:cell division protein FtsB
MIQRRMPSGQGPTRGGGRWSAVSGPRSAAQRARLRRGVRSWFDPAGRPGSRAVAAVAQQRTEHRPGSRPSGVRRAAGPARRTKARREPPEISARGAALGLLFIVLVLAYAFPVRMYLAQQAEIEQLQQAQTEQRERIRGLNGALERWKDPEYIAAQARVRLRLVHAGEKLYFLKSDDLAPGGPDPAAGASWLDQLWSSVEAADDPPQP